MGWVISCKENGVSRITVIGGRGVVNELFAFQSNFLIMGWAVSWI